MKIIRYIDASGRTGLGCEQDDGSVRRLAGDLYSAHEVTAERVQVRQLLAPVVPAQILCIGLNYRQHAVGSGAKVPERPILFVKGINTL